MKKALLILNPKSGKQGARLQMFNIINGLSDKYDVLVHVTKSSEDIFNTAAECSLGTIIVCGGDGTLSHSVDGLMNNPRRDSITLGYIPCGTANDVASSLGLPRRMTDAARFICSHKALPHDVGRFGDRYFIYTASFGTFAKTSYDTPQDAKNLLGGFAYVLNSAPELANIKSRRLTVTYDEGILHETDVTFCALLNTYSLGGGLLRLPRDKVKLDDGKFELLLIRRPKNLAEIEMLVRSFLRGSFDDEMVTLIHSSHFSIQTYEETFWTIDGDSGNDIRNVEVSCVNGVMNMIKR